MEGASPSFNMACPEADVECLLGLVTPPPADPMQALYAAPRTVSSIVARVAAVAQAIPSTAQVVADTLAGTLDINAGGQAIYSIPLQVPIGINGVTPDLQLRYRSSRRNGIVGPGWELAGFSTITRCSQNSGQDDAAAPISDTANDRFCLDGQRLVAISGGYGADGTEYRTETESFVRVFSRGNPGSGTSYTGPISFEVWIPDGRIHLYGTASGTTELKGTVRRTWGVSQIRDRFQNTISFTYTTTFCTPRPPLPSYCVATGLVPKEIYYGSHLATSTSDPEVASDRSVRFIYGTDRADWGSTYERGITRALRHRLDRIDMVVSSNVTWSYYLRYAPYGGLSRLAGVSRCAGATPQCTPETTLSYASNGQAVLRYDSGVSVVSDFGNGPLSRDTGRTIVLDVNGDGRDDVMSPSFVSETGGVKYFNYALLLGQASGSPFSGKIVTSIASGDNRGANPMYPCFSQESVVDFNRDGKDDLIDLCMNPSFGWRVFISTGTGFTTQSLPFLPQLYSTTPLHVADFDGDGWYDFMTCEGGVSSHHVLYRNLGDTAGFAAGRALPQIGRDCDKTPEVLLDVDGDGVVNVFRPTRDPYQEYIYFSQPFDAAPSWQALVITPTTASWVDVPMSPFAPKWVAPGALPNSSDFSYWVEFPPDGDAVITPLAPFWQFKVIDYNGDGLSDILTFQADATPAAARVALYVNTGAGFERVASAFGSSYELDNYAFYRSVIIDWDADGRQDVIVPLGLPGSSPQLTLFRSDGKNGPFTGTVIGGSLDDYGVPLTADFDGDGDADLLIPEKGNKLSYISATTNVENLLTMVEDGLGKRQVVRYANSPGNSLPAYAFTPNCNTSKTECMRRAPPLVAQTQLLQRQTNSSGLTLYPIISESSFSYRDLRVGRFARGSLGFAVMTRVDTEPGGKLNDKTTTKFDNSTFQDSLAGTSAHRWFPLAGQPLMTSIERGEVLDLNDQSLVRVEKTDYQPLAIKLSADNRPFVITPQTQHIIIEGAPGLAGQTVVRTEQTRTFDAYGNVLSENTSTWNGDSQNIASSSMTSTFETDTSGRANWLIRCPLSSIESSTLSGETRTRTMATSPCLAPGMPSLITREPSSSDPSLYLDISLSYDRFGNPAGIAYSDISGTVGRQITYSYDARGLALKSTVEGGSLITTYSIDTAYGGVLSETAPNGLTRLLTYDTLGRPSTITTAYGTQTFSYEIVSRAQLDPVIADVGRLRIRREESGKERIEVIADALGRKIQTRTTGYLGELVTEEYTYDFAGRLLYQSSPHIPGVAQGNTFFEYDRLGRSRFIRRSDESAIGGVATTQMRYGPARQADQTGWDPATRMQAINAIRRTLPSGTSELSGLGAHGETLVTRDALGGLTQHFWGAFVAMKQLRDPSGNITNLTYDLLGRRTTLSDPDSGTEHSTYDTYGSLASVKDAAGALAIFSYDALGRLKKRVDSDGSSSNYQYDGGGVRQGQLVEANTKNAAGETTTSLVYNFTPLGQNGGGKVASATRFMGGATFNLQLSYDGFGRVSSLSYPTVDGQAFSVSRYYDNFGHLISVANGQTGTAYWTLAASSQGYRIDREQFGDGTETQWKYQPLAGRIAGIETRRLAGASVLQQLVFDYDGAGELTTRADSTEPTRSRRYEYDLLGRLSRVVQQHGNNSANELEQFTYNGIGNITSRSSVGAYVYGSGRPHAVTSAGASSYSYDARGNQITRNGPAVFGGEQHIEYTPFDLPSRVTTGSGTSQSTLDITYDAAQRRVYSKASTGTQSWYVDELYERQQTGAAILHRYRIDGPGRVVAEIVVQQQAAGSPLSQPVTRYIHTDGVGSPDLITDAGGVVIERPQFEPFGNSASGSSTVITGFTGHRQVELGLIDMRGRFYDPVLGRFLTPDPVIANPSSSQALNRYSYVYNRPLRFVDPGGLEPITEPWQVDPSLAGPVTDPSQVPSQPRRGTVECCWFIDDPSHLPKDLPPLSRGDNTATSPSGLGSSDTGGSGNAGSGGSGNTSSTGNGAGTVGAQPAGAGKAILATAGGLTVGAGVTAAIAYGLGAVAAACAPCAAGIGLGLALYAAYSLIDGGGGESLLYSADRIAQGQGSVGDYFNVGNFIGAVVGGRVVAKPAFNAGKSHYTPLPLRHFAKIAADIGVAAGKESGAGTAFRKNGRIRLGYSGEKTQHADEMTGVLMGTPKESRADWHGGCGEIVCIDKDLVSGGDPRGGSITSVNIGMSGEGHHTPKKPCITCIFVTDHFGVNVE